MTRYEFDFIKNPCETDEFAEASVHELKVLIALYAARGCVGEDELCERSGVSRARVMAALALWQEAGVIVPATEEKEISFFENSVKNEFPEKAALDDVEEETAISVAATIRSKSLASLFDEIAKMMGKVMLTPQEIKRLSALVSQYNLSEEYIATLAAHLLEEGNLSIGILIKRAITLSGNGIITPEALEGYIADKEREKNDYIEYKRMFGIYDRRFSSTEKEYLNKWSYDFAYGTEVVGMAYDITVLNTSKLSFSYMDKLLSDWHMNSCRTLADCERRYTERKAELDREAEEKRSALEKRRPTVAKKPATRYGDFDAEEAFKLALSRSFTDVDETN